MARRPLLAAARRAAGHSQESLAAQLKVDRTTVARWETGASTPQPWTRPALARLLGLTAGDLPRLLRQNTEAVASPDVDRRTVLGAAAGLGAAVIGRSPQPRRIGIADVHAIRDTTAAFHTVDQRRGGAHARASLAAYLRHDVAAILAGSFASDRIRANAYSAAGELAYLVGWVSFDAGDHADAVTYWREGLMLAGEGDDAPLAGHILRAMAHQALDIGDILGAGRYANASVDGSRYATACGRERALLGVIHGRALVACGQTRSAAAALARAERDLDAADRAADEPGRVEFFGVAALAHETALALRDAGDLAGAERELLHSAQTRDTVVNRRTYAITLGYLAEVQARRSHIDQACATWSIALDVMETIRSGRADALAVTARRWLAPHVDQGLGIAADADERTVEHLSTIA